MNLAYYGFLLLIIFLCIFLMKKNISVSPKKIKVYMTVVITLFLLRYIGLFMLCVVKSGRFVYLLKPILFINHLAIPLMVIALAYVYLRWEKLSFSVNYVVAGILTILYTTSMYVISGKTVFNSNYGYLINIKNEVPLFLGTLIILGILLVFCVMFLDKPHNNKWGMIYLIIGLTVVILENIIYLGGVRIFPYPILGDGIFIVIMYLAFNTFKKKTS